MTRFVFFLTLLMGCTQDFSVFEPDGASADGSADSSVVDVSVDVADVVTQDSTAKDSAADVVDAAPDVAPDAPVACTETGAITFGGHCYFLVATTATQAVAGTNCKNTGNAHLVTITTAGEQAAVIALGSGTERWTDLVHNGQPVKDSNYSWATGESRNGYSAWSPGEPNGTGQCGSLLSTGLWNDQDCTLALASICERE